MRLPIRNPMMTPTAGLVIALTAMPASALEIHSDEVGELHLDGTAMLGLFRSQESYNALGLKDEGSSSWQEAFIDFGFSGSLQTGGESNLYGRVSAVASGTFGDGDAAGFTSGDEHRLAVEDAYLGWRSGQRFSALGENGIDISIGRQEIVLGDGFLISGDALNFGDALDKVAGTDFDRGGAYWLAARKAFDRTALVKIGGDDGLRSDIFWIDSDNTAQGEMELAGINLEFVHDTGTLGLMYLEGLDVKEGLGFDYRDGQETWSLRWQGNAGVEELFLSTELVDQRHGDNTLSDANAWYLEAGWTFSSVPWTPSIAYRYSSFDEHYDPLFFGFTRGYGTWYQGEVAANFAGPFGSDTDVHHLRFEAYPTEKLMIGAGFFNFKDTASGSGALDAKELDIYAEWAVLDNLIISPLVGLYNPKNSGDNGGTQIGSSSSSIYSHLLFIVPF